MSTGPDNNYTVECSDHINTTRLLLRFVVWTDEAKKEMVPQEYGGFDGRTFMV